MNILGFLVKYLVLNDTATKRGFGYRTLLKYYSMDDMHTEAPPSITLPSIFLNTNRVRPLTCLKQRNFFLISHQV